jgi:hypothetical protein
MRFHPLIPGRPATAPASVLWGKYSDQAGDIPDAAAVDAPHRELDAHLSNLRKSG